MTAAELRTLLEKVEAHGGPIESCVGDADDLWIDTESDVRVQSLRINVSDGVADHLVGVLKRDLIKRGYGFEVTYWGGDDPTWTAEVVIFTHHPSDDPTELGTTGREIISSTDDHSELEALLCAWLSAAEAEGWST